MATAIVLPKLGNSVESCLIESWKKQPGETVRKGEILCQVETDKAMMDIESTADGTVLALFFAVGDDVPVLSNIAAVGEPGESFEDLRPSGATTPAASSDAPAPQANGGAVSAPAASVMPPQAVQSAPVQPESDPFISPRARNLAEAKGVDYSGIQGTGPQGRIIERDIEAALKQGPPYTRAAQSVAANHAARPEAGSGLGGRVTTADLLQGSAAPAAAPAATSAPAEAAQDYTDIRVAGARKVIAERMLASLQTTAQLTLNTSIEAESMLAYRKRLKVSDASLGLQSVTINDVLMFAVSRALMQFPALNALFLGDVIRQMQSVHLGFAVDTPRGLLVPVIRNAHQLSLKKLSEEAHRLADACIAGRITPDELQGGSFSVSNLGSLGIESFTPVLNPPQVAILGVGSIGLKPVRGDEGVVHVSHMHLSLTINHQAVDGAPGARFLQALRASLQDIEVLLAT